MDTGNILDKLSDNARAAARVETVFGEPKDLDGATVIPVASAHYWIGAGGGKGSQPGPSGAQVEGEGGGGGAHVRVQPRGYLVKQGDKVVYRPIRGDARRLALVFLLGVLAGLALVGRRHRADSTR
jgi:uncharacterized spore protein YtfJ